MLIRRIKCEKKNSRRIVDIKKKFIEINIIKKHVHSYQILLKKKKKKVNMLVIMSDYTFSKFL